MSRNILFFVSFMREISVYSSISNTVKPSFDKEKGKQFSASWLTNFGFESRLLMGGENSFKIVRDNEYVAIILSPGQSSTANSEGMFFRII